MSKKIYTTQPSTKILVIASIVLLLVGSTVTGYLLSKDQSFSPLPSFGGIIMGLIVATLLSGFVSYANAQYRRDTPGGKSYGVLSVGIGAVIISLLLQHLVRIIG